MLTVGSLFSGIGGFELGLERTGGFQTAWQCERDEYARKILKKHWRGIECYPDIYEICKKVTPGRVDVICGGFPCPAFSDAGRRGGFEQDALMFEMLRVCKELRPRYILFENVEGFAKWKETLRCEVEAIGYEWGDAIIDARDFAVPQSRRRYFAVCVQRGILPSSQHLRGIQGDKGANIREIQPNNQNPKGGWTPTIQTKEEWRTIFANSRRSGDVDGVSNRVDRFRCLGNAVVPQVSEFLGNIILAYEKLLYSE